MSVPVLLTTAEAAAYLTISGPTLETWRYRRLGPPYVKVGGAVRYRQADLDGWLDERTRQPAAPQPRAWSPRNRRRAS